MAHVVHDHHLELALHLGDGQLLVQPLLLRSQQHLRHVDAQEDVGKTLEPP
jgi:hypothetical protein